MSTGYLSTIGRTADFTVTRDRLISMAYETIGLLPPGETLHGEDLIAGIDRLNLIVREIDGAGNWQWTIESSVHVPLQAGVGVYDVNAGLPNNIAELISVVYRDSAGNDSSPLKILQTSAYERLNDKLSNGQPESVYLTNNTALELRKLYIHPIPQTITPQSRVLGTDGVIYRCISPHTSSATNRPTTGANWSMVWEVGSGSTTTWASGTAYTSAESLRMAIKRPIFDFDAEDNTPDFPMQFPRLLLLRLAVDLADINGIPLDERSFLNEKMKGAFDDIFPSTRPKTNNIHNKTRYF